MEPSLPELLLSGAKLMLIGMGIVYLFLALLVWIIGMTHKLLNRYTPEPGPARSSLGLGEAEEDEVVAVIGAALHRYRHP
ncbi:oxaloacetate decarboxylase, gamma subunit [Methylomagnum ishizawai]|uniref:Probable oxaloacetate decarboxylase gamma chain n=1 Tax=Methylomagnum ishizawai TaxID=1760988 RepID=A0A1Y6CXX4_9GAMM|nr:OadG family protein [Methylomagnum ishizawai]SMF95217.1 oxaloacetate decarboxylase, gamma subunit [Methylomagnum ishizawai]